MSVTKNPAIASLDPDSLCYSLYTELYNQFFNAQDRKDASHPYGVEEGDDTSLRLHNAAYGFAYAIAGAVDGTGNGSGQGGVLIDYLRKDGGDMSGMLRANYGFEAGTGNKTLISLYSGVDSAGLPDEGVLFHRSISVTDRIHLGNASLSCDVGGTLHIDSPVISLGDSSIRSVGELLIGESRQTGVYISSDALLFRDNPVYHSGNANLSTVDWTMRNASVSGNFEVSGDTVLAGVLRATRGAELGYGGHTLLAFADGEMAANGNLSFAPDCGISIGGRLVLGRVGVKDIQIGGMDGDLLLGSGATNKIKLVSNLTDTDGSYVLLSPDGAACFPDSLTVRHHFGEVLLASYRMDKEDEGMVIHKRLRFGADSGPYLQARSDGVAFTSHTEYTNPKTGVLTKLYYDTVFRYGSSTSLHRPQNEVSDSFFIDTQADFFVLGKPLEAKTHIGIDGCATRLTSGCLFLSDDSSLQAVSGGIMHRGSAYFQDNLSSELFSSGMAGSGWAVVRNKTTGNTAATFDELTVRKKMRIYELEIQKTNAANGSLWISHHCQGDTVERID